MGWSGSVRTSIATGIVFVLWVLWISVFILTIGVKNGSCQEKTLLKPSCRVRIAFVASFTHLTQITFYIQSKLTLTVCFMMWLDCGLPAFKLLYFFCVNAMCVRAPSSFLSVHLQRSVCQLLLVSCRGSCLSAILRQSPDLRGLRNVNPEAVTIETFPSRWTMPNTSANALMLILLNQMIPIRFYTVFYVADLLV